jgi:HD-GYP domain-containing protein (c-di-GMP phosphodiesterase class II)/predicted MFS family arabinose efflux permease
MRGDRLMHSTLRPAARLYVASVCVLGLGLGAFALFTERFDLANPIAPGIGVTVLAMTAFLLGFAALTSLAPVRVSYSVNLAVNLAPIFAAVLILPPGCAGFVGAFGSIDRLPSRQYPWYRFVWNRCMQMLVETTAGYVFHAVSSQSGGAAQLVTDFNVVAGGVLALLILAFANSSLVITAVALETGEPVRKVADQILRGGVISYLGLAPLGAMIAFLAATRSGEGLAMAGGVMLLLLVYRELSKRALSLESVARGSYVAQSRLVDAKDRSTFGHSERVGILSEAIAVKLRLAGDLVEQVRIGATLHDLGKIAVPDNILHKTGKLTDEEWEIMKSHAQEGYDVLKEQEILMRAAEIVWSHHENFDGTGYPRGLSGRAIPVGGRIARVVDSYDCITNVRDYREWVKGPFEALADIETRKGTWYDPEVVDVFIEVLRERDPRLSAVAQREDDGKPAGILESLRYLPFLKLWSAAALSNFGDMLTTTGLALAGYGATHSILALGAVVAVRALPNLLLGLPAGQLVDRYDRKVLMVLMDIARMVLVGLLPVVASAPLPLILAIALLVSTATVLFNPARAAALPDIVPPRLLAGSNSALAFAERSTEVLGYAVAAALVTFGGISLVFTIDAVTFALSAIILLTVGFPAMVMAQAHGSTLGRIRREITEGVAQISDIPELRAIFIFSFLMVAAGSALLPLIVPLAVEHLHSGNGGFAILEAAIAVGATGGALLTGWLHTPRRGTLMIIGAFCMGVSAVMAGLSSSLFITAAFLVVGGVANMVYLVPMLTSIQELTDSAVRGRVFAARFTMVQVGILVGAAYATITTAAVLPQSAAGIAVAGTGILMIVVAVWAGLYSPIRRL